MADALVANNTKPNATPEPTLKRLMGPWPLLWFIVGDLLGTGIYALTGQIADHVGGAVWLPFLLALLVASFTALSYVELVTKYPRAAGAALYVDKAFGIHFITFIAMLPVAGALSSAFLVGPWTGREPVQYAIAGVMIAIGIALWFVTLLLNRAMGYASSE